MRLLLGLIIPLGVAACAIFLASRGNHHAVDMRYTIIVLALCIPCVLFILPIRQALFITGVCVLVTIFILLADHYNILVEYNRWLKRGQPAPFSTSCSSTQQNMPPKC